MGEPEYWVRPQDLTGFGFVVQLRPMSPLGCSTTAAVGRRYSKGPTAEEAAEQREAWNQAQQEMADRHAAVAAARSATLQRNMAAHCVGQLFGYEEDLHIGSDEGYVADDMDDDGDVGPSNGGQQRQPSGGPGHGERRLRYELAFQRENEKAVHTAGCRACRS
jgi:hypothetical protein